MRKKPQYDVVHEADIDLVTIIDPDLVHGPWIAGGAVLRWVQGLPLHHHDIDVFLKDSIQLKTIYDRLVSKDYYQIYKTDNAITLNKTVDAYNSRVQLILKPFPNVKSLLHNFDFSVCAVATDGNEIVCTDEFLRDYPERKLRLQGIMRDDIFKRLMKYSVYGYEPADELLDQFYERSNLISKFNGTEDYDFNM